MKAIELKHPLVEHKLAILRDKKTGTKEFREIVSELATMLCYEAMKDAEMHEVEIETPIQKMKTRKIDENNYAFVPILRAGTGMLDGIISVMPNAKIGHIGMYRNEETFKPTVYFFKVPKDINKREVLIIDPTYTQPLHRQMLCRLPYQYLRPRLPDTSASADPPGHGQRKNR